MLNHIVRIERSISFEVSFMVVCERILFPFGFSLVPVGSSRGKSKKWPQIHMQNKYGVVYYQSVS